jgi:hypothetical protein
VLATENGRASTILVQCVRFTHVGLGSSNSRASLRVRLHNTVTRAPRWSKPWQRLLAASRSCDASCALPCRTQRRRNMISSVSSSPLILLRLLVLVLLRLSLALTLAPPSSLGICAIVREENDDCRDLAHLLKCGFDPKLHSGIIINAARRGMLNTVRMLAGAGADVNVPGGDHDVRALHLAASSGQVAMVELLLSAGAEVDAATNRAGDGCTALHRAAHEGNAAVIDVLLDAGADVHATTVSNDVTDHDRNELTALWLAAEGPMDSSPDGRSAVWLAADGGHHGVVRALSAAIESYGGHPGVTHALTAGKAIGRVRKGRRASC